MRAAILDKYGAIDSVRIGELDPPKVAAATILVRVVAAAINPADYKVVHGKDGGGFLHAKNFPTAIGFDFSGVVEQVGANVQGRSIGDLKASVQETFPLSDITTALSALESGSVRGKLIVRISEQAR